MLVILGSDAGSVSHFPVSCIRSGLVLGGRTLSSGAAARIRVPSLKGSAGPGIASGTASTESLTYPGHGQSSACAVADASTGANQALPRPVFQLGRMEGEKESVI